MRDEGRCVPGLGFKKPAPYKKRRQPLAAKANSAEIETRQRPPAAQAAGATADNCASAHSTACVACGCRNRLTWPMAARGT